MDYPKPVIFGIASPPEFIEIIRFNRLNETPLNDRLTIVVSRPISPCCPPILGRRYAGQATDTEKRKWKKENDFLKWNRFRNVRALLKCYKDRQGRVAAT